MTMEGTVAWIKNMQFVGWSGTKHSVVMDTDSEHGGDNTGAKPMELLLLALAGCTGMDVVSILKKMRVVFTGLEIKLRGERREEHPRIFTRIDMEYIVYGSRVDENAVKRAIELSMEKYCSVYGIIKNTCPVNYTYRILPEREMPSA